MRAWHSLLALTSGGLIHLSLAPYNLQFTALIGLAIFAALCAVAERVRQIFWLAFVFGTGLYAAGVHWVYVSINTYGDVPAPLALVLTGGFVACLALLFTLPWLLVPLISTTPASRLIAFPACWLFNEWLRGWLLTGFPWLYVGYGQVDGLLRGWLPLIGVPGAGAIIACVAAALVYILYRRSLVSVGLTGAACLALWLSSDHLAELEWTETRGRSVPVTLVQPDIPLRDKWNPNKLPGILEVLESSSSGAWHPGLLIWPEAAIPYTGDTAISYIEFLDNLASASGAAMITGLLTQQESRYFNSILGLGHASGLYHKQRLVPFGEYVPLEDQLRGLMHFFDLPMSVISRGPEIQQPLEFVFDDQPYRVAPAICYEIAYSGLVRTLAENANLLVTISNDAWFGTSIGPAQHMQIAQARALENQKPLIRVTNNGITGTISSRGVIQADLPQFTRTQLHTSVIPRSGQTPFVRWGNWVLLMFGLGAVTIAAVCPPKKKLSLSHELPWHARNL